MHGLMRGSYVLYRKEELDIHHGENFRFEWLKDVIPKNWRCRIMLSTLHKKQNLFFYFFYGILLSAVMPVRCSQLYRMSTQRINIDMKPKEVLIEAVNKFLKEKLKEKGFVFSDSQLKFTKKLKDGLIGEIGFSPMSYS